MNISLMYNCIYCNYTTKIKSNLDRHCLTQKHIYKKSLCEKKILVQEENTNNHKYSSYVYFFIGFACGITYSNIGRIIEYINIEIDNYSEPIIY